MFRWAVSAFAVLVSLGSSSAQDAIPDLKGTWKGQGSGMVIGSDPFLRDQAASEAPHKVDLDLTFTIKGQEGRVLWGELSSSASDFTKVFAWAVADDNRTILGADADGLYWLRIVSTDRLDRCYVQTSAGAVKSVIASCFAMERQKE